MPAASNSSPGPDPDPKPAGVNAHKARNNNSSSRSSLQKKSGDDEKGETTRLKFLPPSVIEAKLRIIYYETLFLSLIHI